ncbi:MAG: ABC transporter permease [Oligoflexia bacterium]|nr:ABC transporter permease [Oligoflexia bacterium]
MKSKFIYPILPLIIISLALEILVKTNFFPSYLVPAPSQVFKVLSFENLSLWKALGQTSLASILGFTISLVLGVLFAILLSTSKLIEKVFYPYAVFFQTVPIIAIAPLLVIWLGYGLPTIVASSIIVSIFPVIANTLTGLRSTEKPLLDLFRLYSANPKDTLLKLKLPFALPSVLVGARISSGLAVIGAIVGEFIAGGGIGEVVNVSRTQQRVDIVFAAVFLAALLGLAFFLLIDFISKATLKAWHASER